MALVSLVPFPTDRRTTAWADAAAYVRRACSGRTIDGDDAVCGLAEAAAALIEREAPGAPQAIKNESLIRFVGYLAQADFGAIASESTVGNKQIEYTVNHSAIFRNSGAKGLLAPWKIRRAGAIG